MTKAAKYRPVVCVVKMTPKKHGQEAILFYRDDYGFLVCFTRSEGHSGCCLEYYRECVPPKTPKEIRESDELFALYDTIPGCDVGIVRRKKLPGITSQWTQ